MLPRFLAADLDTARGEAWLRGGEAHHLQRVLRLEPGADVIVFDGRGQEFRARVGETARDSVRVTLLERVTGPPEPAVDMTLVQSVLKAGAMDDVVRDCTMIGVREIRPVISARTTVKASLLPKAVERWRRIAVASAKQCGRTRLPVIADPAAFDEWVAGGFANPAFLLLEPSAGRSGAVTVRDLAHVPPPAQATLVVGPEGGWTDPERTRAIEAGCAPLTLGPLTLRADAVPLAAAAALLSVWE
jgi:16S rRNA (uracil1498-N3)-methyltransferase